MQRFTKMHKALSILMKKPLENLFSQLVLWHGQHNQVSGQALRENLVRMPWVSSVVLVLLAVGLFLAWGVGNGKSPSEAVASNLIGWINLSMMVLLLCVLVMVRWGQLQHRVQCLTPFLPVVLATMFVAYGLTLSILSQWILPSATMYVIGCVFVGSMLLVRPSTMALIFGFSYAIFYGVLGLTAKAWSVLVIMRFHGALAAALGLTLSLVLWRRHTVTELLRRQVQAQNAELALQKAQMEALSQCDALTGLLNRRAFEAQAEVTLSRARREGTGLAALMLDLDHFKRVNDQHGHPAGDAVIQFMADVLRTSVRDTDLVARVGGEEFMVLLPGTVQEAGVEVAEKIRLRLMQTPVRLGESMQIHMTVSVGVAEYAAGKIGDFDSLYAAADQALYGAKRAGRNRVEVSVASSLPLT